MGCGCSSLGNDGKKVADLVREKGFQDMHTKSRAYNNLFLRRNIYYE